MAREVGYMRVQRPQSSKQSKRPEDQAVGAGAPPTGTPVTGCAAGFIYTTAGELERCDELFVFDRCRRVVVVLCREWDAYI